MSGPFRKICACGESYDRLRWASLVQVGYMPVDEGWLELRHCSCGSTIAVPCSQNQQLMQRARAAGQQAQILRDRAEALLRAAHQRRRRSA